VTVSFSGSDSLSGIASCSAPVTLSAEGANQSASGACTDLAGNVSAAATASGINIDKTPPAIVILSPANGGVYLRNEVVPANYSCGDALSGIASCAGPVPSGSNIDTSTLGVRTFGVTATDMAGNASVAGSTYSVNPSATIKVAVALHTVGTGTNPGSVKTPLALNLKVFDKARVGSPDPKDFGTIWASGPGLAFPAVSISDPVVTSVGGGTANVYTILAPSSDPANSSVSSGSYLVIGQALVNGAPVFVGSPTDPLATDSVTNKYLQVIQNGNGKVVPATTTEVPGSLLLIAAPEYLEYTSAEELLPVIYESVDGEWSAVVRADPPEGFVSNPGALRTEVGTGSLQALQFTIRDVGSSWTSTKVTHHLKHKGKNITVVTEHKMVNKRK